MAEYIRRDIAIARLTRLKVTDKLATIVDAKREIADMPAAAGDPVVYCKDCAYSYEDIGGRTCSHGVCVDCIVPDDFCCAYGKREENNNEAGN